MPTIPSSRNPHATTLGTISALAICPRNQATTHSHLCSPALIREDSRGGHYVSATSLTLRDQSPAPPPLLASAELSFSEESWNLSIDCSRSGVQKPTLDGIKAPLQQKSQCQH